MSNVIVITDQLNPEKPLIPLDLNKIKSILLHHSEHDTAGWKDINQWHKNNGWSCGGYNELILKDGTVYIMRGDNIGAQCANYNSQSYGICLQGDYHNNPEPMPEAQFKALIERIKYNTARFPNFQDVAPHSKYYPTACPGQYFPFDRVIEEVNRKEVKVVIETLDQAIELLVTKNKIDPNYPWKTIASVVKFLDQIFIKWANDIK